MPRLAKIVGWLAVAHGLLTLGILVIVSFVQHGFSSSSAVIGCLVGVIGIVAGAYSLKGRPWAFWLLFGLYLVQVADYWTPGFYISFMGPAVVNFGWNLSSPPRHFDLNLLAITVCILAVICARGLTNHSSGRSPATRARR
ncbi:MAG: hypothetical protein JSR56_11695 [Proteobacteria bacterium]|nr:hypothetical protein [Pseudomonadota bacterium]